MRNFSYDAEGDILTVTFCEAAEDAVTGIELHENVVLYFNPDQGQILELILISYGAMLKKQAAIPLESLAKLEPEWQQIVLDILQKAPANHFFHLEKKPSGPKSVLYLKKIFDPEIIKSAA